MGFVVARHRRAGAGRVGGRARSRRASLLGRSPTSMRSCSSVVAAAEASWPRSTTRRSPMAIASSALPVFTGLGHEIDRSVADEVAHSALKTPTACAAALVERVQAFQQRAEQAWRAIAHARGSWAAVGRRRPGRRWPQGIRHRGCTRRRRAAATNASPIALSGHVRVPSACSIAPTSRWLPATRQGSPSAGGWSSDATPPATTVAERVRLLDPAQHDGAWLVASPVPSTAEPCARPRSRRRATRSSPRSHRARRAAVWRRHDP